MKKYIVIINGSGGTGKDQFCALCASYVKCKVVSTVDKVKEAYSLLGWNGDKSEQHRKALSDIKDIGTKNLDHPFTYISKIVEKFRTKDDQILFIHSREPEEIARFVKEFDCITLLIINPNIENIKSNHADANVFDYKYDYKIYNDGSVEDLKLKAKQFIERLFNEVCNKR